MNVRINQAWRASPISQEGAGKVGVSAAGGPADEAVWGRGNESCL